MMVVGEHKHLCGKNYGVDEGTNDTVSSGVEIKW